MTTQSPSFKRLVLGFQWSAPDRTLRLAVELAELLHLELLGLFLEDTSLRHLAALPFARELRPMNGGWHAIDLERLSSEIERAARNVERMLNAATKNLMTRCQFEIVRGPLAATLMSISRAGDIVMVFEPVNPAERVSQQFAWLIEGAFRSAAAVMIVPRRIVRMTGPVVVIAAGLDDPGVDAAASIARAAREQLVLVDVGETRPDEVALETRCAALGCTITPIAVGADMRGQPAGLVRVLDRIKERLLVVTRGVFDDHAVLATASSRGVPVLVIEPAAAAKATP